MTAMIKEEMTKTMIGDKIVMMIEMMTERGEDHLHRVVMTLEMKIQQEGRVSATTNL